MKPCNSVRISLLFFVLSSSNVECFTSSSIPTQSNAALSFRSTKNSPTLNSKAPSVLASTAALSSETNVKQVRFTTVFDFTTLKNDNDDAKKAIDQFERIDDAIMGGISTSTLRLVPDKQYASFSGVCREDGGGFCGMRTLPFVVPLNATNTEGVFLDCKLVSDDEPDRRAWKMTVRTDTSRGEQVYQSQFEIPKGSDAWKRIQIPFDSFCLVRGPRMIPNAPPLNTTGGLYQIGMTMSKFCMNENLTTIDNFRAGFFNLNIERIGLFSKQDDFGSKEKPIKTLSKKDAARNRPLILQILLPIARLFFSEKANRRKSAMRILREERGLNRINAILFGIRSRAKGCGIIPSIAKTASILSVDASRTVFTQILKVCVLFPIRILRKFIFIVQKYIFGKEPKRLPSLN